MEMRIKILFLGSAPSRGFVVVKSIEFSELCAYLPTQLTIAWTPHYQSDNVRLPISFALMPCSSQTPRSFAKSSQFTPSLSQYSPLSLPNPSLQLVTLPTSPPPLPTPEPHQALPANLIPALQQRRYIYIERTIYLRIRKQLVDGLQRRCERVRRRPRRLQEVEADFACFEIHVWVADRGRESDFGWCERVGGGDEDVEVPETG